MLAAIGNDEAASGDTDFREELDPSVQTELEVLNQSAMEINRLEKEIDEARAKYQTTFQESSQQLEFLRTKYGASIKRARPYYELQEAARAAQGEALRSARKFQASNGVYLAAKETISLAELRLMDDKAVSLSAAWQEMLNHALHRVTEAEKEKSVNEQEHLKKAAMFADMEKRLHVCEKKNKRSIAKARSYFDIKKELDIKLQQLKQTVEDMQQAFQAAKLRYSGALKRLEKISDSIHEQRRHKFLLMFPREPGVGAEDVCSCEKETYFPTLSSTEQHNDDSGSSFDDSDSDEFGQSFDGKGTDKSLREKVLTLPLEDDNLASTLVGRDLARKKACSKKQLKRSLSLPLYSCHRLQKPQECNCPHNSTGSQVTEGGLEKPLLPLSDRSENYPPDGQSISSEKSVSEDIQVSYPQTDICEAKYISQDSPLVLSKMDTPEDHVQESSRVVALDILTNTEPSPLNEIQICNEASMESAEVSNKENSQLSQTIVSTSGVLVEQSGSHTNLVIHADQPV